jgi:hypothetical protein
MLLFVLLLVVVACPSTSGPPTPDELFSFEKPAKSAGMLGLCANRSTIYYVIGGFFFLITGMQIANRKKPRIPTIKPTTKVD